MLTFICYPKCSTCQKAKALLDSYHAKYETRDIKAENPSYEELKEWHASSVFPVRRFFNTSGLLYRSLGLKDKLPLMSEDECLKLLATDGMLVKRPLLVDKGLVLVGFNRDEWVSRLAGFDHGKQTAKERSTVAYRVILRNEKKSDWNTVEQITYRAFRDAPPTGADDGNEALLAQKLRGRVAFVPKLDYVAELDGAVIGNIMYTRSKVVSDDGDEWETLTFGPLSVLPKYQRQGVGGALVRKTLEIARDLGYRAVLIYGYESYYPRFGFKPASEYDITTADGENFPAFMALPLYNGALDGVHGRLICDEAYSALDKDESDKLNAKLAESMDVDEYIDAQPAAVEQLLRKVRTTIQTAAPDAIEKISYQMPTYWQGHNLIHFAAQKRHLGIYPGAEAMKHFAPRLIEYKTSKGAIQFPYKDFGDAQLALITEITAWCAARHNETGPYGT